MKLIPKHQPEIVLMDVQLPNMSGIECMAAQLKQSLPGLHIIMVTVYGTRSASSGARAGVWLSVEAVHDRTARRRARFATASAHVAGDCTEVIALIPRAADRRRRGGGTFAARTGILELLAAGFPNKQIADRLGLTDGTCAGTCGMSITSCTSARAPRRR